MEQSEESIAAGITMDGIDREHGKFAAMVRFSGLPPASHMKKRLFTFLPIPGSEEAYQAALQFVSGSCKHHFLTLAGKAGRGKTHLAFGIGWHWLEVKHLLVKYSQVESLLDELRAGYRVKNDEEAYSFDNKMSRLKKCPLLILDDLGVEQSTPWAEVKLDEIIDYRYEHEFPTVVTTNMAPERLGERISGRLKEGICVHMTCGNYREVIAADREEYEGV